MCNGMRSLLSYFTCHEVISLEMFGIHCQSINNNKLSSSNLFYYRYPLFSPNYCMYVLFKCYSHFIGPYSQVMHVCTLRTNDTKNHFKRLTGIIYIMKVHIFYPCFFFKGQSAENQLKHVRNSILNRIPGMFLV